MSDRLFDMTPFGGEEPTEQEQRSQQEPRVPLPVEPWRHPWTMVRDNQGPLPHFHLIRTKPGGLGEVMTLCKRWGTVITNAGVDQMIRCPECDLAAQMKNLLR